MRNISITLTIQLLSLLILSVISFFYVSISVNYVIILGLLFMCYNLMVLPYVKDLFFNIRSKRFFWKD